MFRARNPHFAVEGFVLSGTGGCRVFILRCSGFRALRALGFCAKGLSIETALEGQVGLAGN